MAFDHPAWAAYLPNLRSLDRGHIGQPNRFNNWLAPGTQSHSGQPIRFVNECELAAAPYEQTIHDSGKVSTRADNLHDLCNALVWARMPACKAMLNHLHVTAPVLGAGRHRGPLRDALTLLDESGLIVLSSSPALLRALQQHDWTQAFVTLKHQWRTHTRLLLMGHAVLEKLLNPYTSITAKCLLIQASPSAMTATETTIDRTLAICLQTHRWLSQPRDLSALPIMGIPGWWTKTPQDSKFYADQDVFRPPGVRWRPSPIRDWPDASDPVAPGASP